MSDLLSGRQTIVIVAHDVDDSGGMERALGHLIRNISARNRVVVIASSLSPDLRSHVTWHRVPVPRRPFPAKFFCFFLLGGILLRLHRRSGLVVTQGAIVPNHADATSLQFCHADFASLGGDQQAHSGPAGRKLNNYLSRRMALLAERWCYRPGRLRALVAASNGIGRSLSSLYPGIPVFIAPNGVDLVRFSPDEVDRDAMRRQHGVLAEDFVVLFVGGDWSRKGLALAISALSQVDSHGSNIHLWVVGRGDQARYSEIATELGVADQLVFFGPRKDTERFYRGADALLLPSQYEAFPLVSLEAAATATPVIATGVHGVVDLIGNDEAGLLIRFDSQSIADAIGQLSQDESLRARLSLEARTRAETYTWDHAADRWRDVWAFLRRTP